MSTQEVSTASESVLYADVDHIDQLFNASSAAPMARSDALILGVPAVEELVTRIQLEPARDWSKVGLVLRLPREQVAPEVEAQLAVALRRYSEARIRSNQLRVRLERKQRSFGLVVALAVAVGAIAVTALLLVTVLSGLSSSVQTIVVGLVGLFSWVVVWGPLEALLFGWAPAARENRALERLSAMPVRVEACEVQPAVSPARTA
jgi:hypothetical protein